MRRAPAPLPQDHMPLTSLAGPAHAATHGGAFPAAWYRSRWEYSCIRADGWWLVTVVALANAIWGARAPRSARSGGRSRPGMGDRARSAPERGRHGGHSRASRPTRTPDDLPGCMSGALRTDDRRVRP